LAELIKLASLFETKKDKITAMRKGWLQFGYWLEIHLTLSGRIDSPTVFGREDIQFLPTGWNFKKNGTQYINWIR
jgi:hypothetical protein